MKSFTGAAFCCLSSLALASSHVSVMLAGPNGVTLTDVPTDNQPLSVANRMLGNIERATVTFVSDGLDKARCRAFLDEAGTELIGGKIQLDEDTPIGGAIKSLRCSPTLVLDGSFPVNRWVGGTADGHASALPSPSSVAGAPPTTDASKSVSILIGDQTTAGVKRIPLDGKPFVLSQHPPRFNNIDQAQIQSDGGVAGAQCQAYSDEAATVSVGEKVTSTRPQQYSDERIKSFICSISGASPPGSPSAPSSAPAASGTPSSTPAASSVTFTTDPSKSVMIRISNANTGSVKMVPLDMKPFVLSQNPPTVDGITSASMVNNAGVNAECNTYSDEAAVMSLHKPVNVNQEQTFSPPKEAVVSLRCHIKNPGTSSPAPAPSPAQVPAPAPSPNQSAQNSTTTMFTTDASKHTSVKVGNDETSSVKTIALDMKPFVLSKNPPLVGDIKLVQMNSNGGAPGAECNAYSDEAAVMSLHKPVNLDQPQTFTPDEKVVSLRCHIKTTSGGAPAPPPAAPSETQGTSPAPAPAPAPESPSPNTSKRIILNIGNHGTATSKTIPLDNQPFILSRNPPDIGDVKFATMVSNAGVASAQCQPYSDEAANESLGSKVTIGNSATFNVGGGEVVRSFRCNVASATRRRGVLGHGHAFHA